jgi:hypothetical protein
VGLASQNATISAENQLMAQQQQQMQASQNYIQTMNALWDQRTKGSKIVTTNSSTTSASEQSPGGGLLGGLGYALGNKDSWLNKNVLGKKPMGGGPVDGSKPIDLSGLRMLGGLL